MKFNILSLDVMLLIKIKKSLLQTSIFKKMFFILNLFKILYLINKIHLKLYIIYLKDDYQLIVVKNSFILFLLNSEHV